MLRSRSTASPRPCSRSTRSTCWPTSCSPRRPPGCRDSHDRELAAVDHEPLAMDEARVVGGEESEGGGDVLDAAEPAERDIREVVVGEARVLERRVERGE